MRAYSWREYPTGLNSLGIARAFISALSIMQKRIQTLVDRLVSQGPERGLQVAAYVDGKLVLNAWAGVADAVSGRTVDADTLFPVFSTTKGMAATIIHLLVERGQLSYDEPIASVWPEFAAHGKGGITLRHALNHTAGIPLMPRDITASELHDWDTMCRKIAALEPFTPAGAKMEYHAMTYGWLLGEVARRADGRAFPQLLAEEICRPLGMEAMYAGIPDAVEPRVAILEEYETVPVIDDGKPQSVPHWLWPLHAWMNRPDARRSCIPASNGIMNALSIARHYAALLPGGVDGVELLPPHRIKLAMEPQKPSQPQDDDFTKNRGLGYGLGWKYGNPATSFGSAGYGGSFGFADLELKLAFGFTKNLYHKEDTAAEILKEVHDALKK